MATIPTTNLEVEEKGRQVSQDCFGIPTILRRMLEHLSTRELIKLSRVNKLWNYEARSVMRKRGTVTARLGRDSEFWQESCQKLIAAFASGISKMPVVPFSGIILDMYHSNSKDESTSEASLESSSQVILDRLAWKYFSVKFCARCWDDCKDCPALGLVKKILEDNCGTLEELSLGYAKEDFLGNLLQDRSLPCLKILKIDKGNCGAVGGPLTSAFIKALVSRAPNLQDLHVKGELHFTENVLEGSSAVLVPTGVFSPLRDPVPQNLAGSIRAEKMEIRIHDHINGSLLNTFVPKLLEASRTKLTTLQMDLLFALPLICYDIRLENVTRLEIRMNGNTLDYIEPHVLHIIRRLNFTDAFPKLDQVTILDDHDYEFSSDVVEAFLEQGNEITRRLRSTRAIHIKLIKFHHFYSIQESTLSLLAQIFPFVKTLDMIGTPYYDFCELREHFQHLQEVTES